MTDPAAKTPDEPLAEPSKAAHCKHGRKRLIAKDEDAEYWECLDCGEIYEAGESGGVLNLDGSLSDA